MQCERPVVSAIDYNKLERGTQMKYSVRGALSGCRDFGASELLGKVKPSPFHHMLNITQNILVLVPNA